MSIQLNYLFLLFGLVLSGIPAVAQSFPAIAQLDTQLVARAIPDTAAAAPSAAAPDTAAAIHRLFLAKRKKRLVIVAATVVVGAVGSGVLIGTASTYTITFQAFAGVMLIPATTIAALTELVCYNRYSRRHERQAIADYQNHILPKPVRQKLAARYFQP